MADLDDLVGQPISGSTTFNWYVSSIRVLEFY